MALGLGVKFISGSAGDYLIASSLCMSCQSCRPPWSYGLDQPVQRGAGLWAVLIPDVRDSHWLLLWLSSADSWVQGPCLGLAWALPAPCLAPSICRVPEHQSGFWPSHSPPFLTGKVFGSHSWSLFAPITLSVSLLHADSWFSSNHWAGLPPLCEGPIIRRIRNDSKLSPPMSKEIFWLFLSKDMWTWLLLQMVLATGFDTKS